MLSNSQGHTPTGHKLYRLDDHTICAMAGLYSEPGPGGLESFSALIPAIIQDYLDSFKRFGPSTPGISFSFKAQALQQVVEFELTTHIHALLIDTPSADVSDQRFLLELTMAGYDLDGTLKVADITMRPAKTPRGVSFKPVERPIGQLVNPPCEFEGKYERLPELHEKEGTYGLTIHTVGKSLFCDIAGMPEVAEELLTHPLEHPGSPELNAYAEAKAHGNDLSLSELRSLAVYLVDETGSAERKNRMYRVGGAPQIAVLSNGSMLESPPDLPAETRLPSSLSANRISAKFTCPPGKIYIANSVTPLGNIGALMRVGQPVVDAQGDLTNCTQPIDGIVFHDSSFTDSVLTFDGAGLLLFGGNNVITRTSLKLGPKVVASEPAIHKLICGFSWKAVYQSKKELKVNCP